MEEHTDNQKKYLIAGLVTVAFLILGIVIVIAFKNFTPREEKLRFKAIDTMKYSRDLAREKLNDQEFDKVIEQQIAQIAGTGATHVAIATPYDEEFLPILNRWVKFSRKYQLKVWFRGNFSGWEKWFEYAPITREEHIQKSREFILKNKGLFQDGDIFSGCPECENGGPGDPRTTQDIEGHRRFLIEEHLVCQDAFVAIHKKVSTSFNSMNYDVAKLIMDKNTTMSLGGIVAIDHYVKTSEQLNRDITQIAKQSGGKVILGEYGAPIPDIHGKMSEEDQASWLEKLFHLLPHNKNLVGLSYWTNVGGSTQLWNSDGKPREAVKVLTKFYTEN